MFEFKTKEERAAWQIVNDILNNDFNEFRNCMSADALIRMAEAAARFDEREKLCGIEPNSYYHGLLMVSQTHALTHYFDPILPLKKYFDRNGILNDIGKELLANLNRELCK